ncbi:hypothetical protein [Lutibacter sp.]|uniref:hypothetical protein n=1 Tax=Lutibacter sp. TaxID=1925666 RepID=UPI0035662345
MKSSSVKSIQKETQLKVVNNTLHKKSFMPTANNRIYINTLIPGFSFINHNKEIVTGKNCILL